MKITLNPLCLPSIYSTEQGKQGSLRFNEANVGFHGRPLVCNPDS
jgi:hypothetical protein